MKKITLLLTLIVFTNFLFAQDLVPYLGKNGLYGYSDLEGKVLIEPKYDEVTFFDTLGFANVRKNGRWTLVNKKGKELMPFVIGTKYGIVDVENERFYHEVFEERKKYKHLKVFVKMDF